MRDTNKGSLRRLLFSHELAFLFLVAVAGVLGGFWAYFWQQTSAESIRLNALSHTAHEIRTNLFRQVKEVSLARMRDDPNAETVYAATTKAVKEHFNVLRRRSETRAEAYAVQALQEAYSKLQLDMNAIFDDPYLLNRMVRSKLLDPSYEQALVAEFELAASNFQGLINQQLDASASKVALWTRFARFVIPVPIIIAVLLLVFSRQSLKRGFVKPVQSLVALLRHKNVSELAAMQDLGGVSEVDEIARSVRQMALELEESREAAMETERQAALGALVPVVAHNIRNPLASIRASAQLLEADSAADEILECRDGVIETVDRLERWVSALVSYLHPLRPNRRMLRAASLFEANLQLLRPKLEQKSIHVRLAPWSESIEVEADPDLMEQAIYGLLLNAVEASPSNAEIQCSLSEEGEFVHFDIIDEAGGMSFAPEPTGLEPGPTTKKRGTGLGIPVAFKVCKAHGWEISFDIRDGKGTVVHLSAPKVPDESNSAAAVASTS